MPNQIHWRLYVRAKREAKAQKVLQRVIAAIGLPAEDVTVEQYWKTPELYDVGFTTPIETATQPEAVVVMILAAQRIGGGWGVGLYVSADGSWDFGMGKARSSFRVSGVESASLDLTIKPGPHDHWLATEHQPSQLGGTAAAETASQPNDAS
jgi:hypothetical protein